MKVEFTGLAVIPQWQSVKRIESATDAPCFLMGDKNDMAAHGYSVVGTATMVVELHDPKDIHAGKVAALQEQLQAVRADNHRKENAILEQISKLQAIDYDPSAPSGEKFPDIPF